MSGLHSDLPSLETVPDVYLGKLCSYHGWGNHDSNECTVLHPNLLTPEVKARLCEKFKKLDTDGKWARVTCWNCGGRGHTKKLCPQPENLQAQKSSEEAHERKKKKYEERNGSSVSSRSSSAGSITSLSSGTSSQLTIGPAPSGLTFSDSKLPPRPTNVAVIELTDWPRQLIQSELEMMRSVCPGITNVQPIHCGARVIFSSNATMNSGLAVFKSIELAGKKPKVAHFSSATSLTGPPSPLPQSLLCPSPTASTSASSPTASSTPWAADFNKLSSEVKDTNKRLDKFEKKLDGTDSKIDEIHRLLMGKKTPAKSKRKPANDGGMSEDDDGDMNDDDDLEYDGVFTDEKFPAAARELLTGFIPKLVKDVEFYAVLLNVSGSAVVCGVTLTKSKSQDMSRPNLMFAHFKGEAIGKKAWIQQNLIFEQIECASGIAHNVNELIRSSSSQ